MATGLPVAKSLINIITMIGGNDEEEKESIDIEFT